MIYWTKYKLVYGENYENELNFFEGNYNFVKDFQGGLPSKIISKKNPIANGAIFQEINFYSGYSAKLNILMTGWNLIFRDTLFIIADLQEYIPKKLVRTQIINNIEIVDELLNCQIEIDDGEKYQAGNCISEFSFKILSTENFFQEVSQTEIFNDSINTLQEFTVTNSGLRTYADFLFTLNDDSEYLLLKLAEGYGFRIDYSMTSGQEIFITVENETLKLYIDDIEIFNAFSINSMPFYIPSGDNIFYYEGANADLEINIYRKRL